VAAAYAKELLFFVLVDYSVVNHNINSIKDSKTITTQNALIRFKSHKPKASKRYEWDLVEEGKLPSLADSIQLFLIGSRVLYIV
jgi:hypothetical protein